MCCSSCTVAFWCHLALNDTRMSSVHEEHRIYDTTLCMHCLYYVLMSVIRPYWFYRINVVGWHGMGVFLFLSFVICMLYIYCSYKPSVSIFHNRCRLFVWSDRLIFTLLLLVGDCSEGVDTWRPRLCAAAKAGAWPYLRRGGRPRRLGGDGVSGGVGAALII